MVMQKLRLNMKAFLDEYKKREGLDDKTMQENYKTELKSELLMATCKGLKINC